MIVVVLAGGLTLCAGGVILFAYLRRRRNAKAESEKSLPTAHGTTLSGHAEPPRHERRAGRARRRQFIPVVHERRAGLLRRHRDRPQGALGKIFAEEMEPLAEADAYLTHGHNEEAEHILRDAIAKDPARHELKFKLLAIYHQRQDEVAFYVLADELYTALGGRGDELWDRVEAMGRSLKSDKPMFRDDLQADGETTCSGDPDPGVETPRQSESQFKDPQQRKWDAPAAKLDLAKAYLDRGDAKRARDILEEILARWTQG